MSAPNGNLAKYGDQIKELTLQGMPVREVCEAMGKTISYRQVAGVVHQLRQRGVIPKYAEMKISYKKTYGDKIKQMSMEGHRTAAIVEALGGALSNKQVSRIIRSMRESGELPPFKLENSHRPRGYKIGSITDDMINRLTVDQQRWLWGECARLECANLSEYILELVRDAHAEAVL